MNKMLSARFSEQTIDEINEYKTQYNMSDSDILRVMVMFGLTHRVELHAFIARASQFVSFNGKKENTK